MKNAAALPRRLTFNFVLTSTHHCFFGGGVVVGVVALAGGVVAGVVVAAAFGAPFGFDRQ
jgi:hypothetical protein